MRARRTLALLGVAALLSGGMDQAAAAVRRAPQKVTFEAPAGETLLVHGEYPPVESRCVEPTQPLLHARFRGAVEVHRGTDGSLFVIGELPFEDYLKGIAEVPRRWPTEALKAQVVAARSYALSRIAAPSSRARALGYDLCATDACQVYLGTGVERGAWGERWARAVDETAGEVLLFRGRPAQTLYFSTSNGRTYGNDEVWGTEPVPYLRGVPEADDGGSPLAHWEVAVPFADLARFLRAAGLWGGGPIRGVRDAGDHIVLRGGGRARLHRDVLRDALNATAGCLDPDAYPPAEPDGYRLPQTVPSVWYRARQEDGALVLEGRGWGHGVGMVQWGAEGKAERGLSYDDILAAYYGGLRPQPYGTPETIRVLIAEGLDSVTVAPSGEAKVRARGRVRTSDEPWAVEASGAGLRLRRAAAPPAELRVTGFAAQRRGGAGAGFRASFTASGAVRARLEFLRGDEVVAVTPWGSHEGGEVTLSGTLPAGRGRYLVRARATDGVDTVLTPARPVVVTASAPAEVAEGTPAPPAAPDAGGGGPGPLALGLLGGGLALLVLLLAARRGRPRRS